MTDQSTTPTEPDAEATQRTRSQDSSSDEPSSADEIGSDTDVIYSTHPTIRPPLLWMSATILAGGSVALVLLQDLIGLTDPQVATIGGLVVAFTTLIVVVRLLVTIYILRKTKYIITETGVKREFSLWFRRWHREVPFSQIRAYEFDQNRIQRFFGVSTVPVLTGGTNASLGFVGLKNVPDPEEIEERT